MSPGAQKADRRKKRCSRHDATASFRIPRAAHARGSCAHSGRRENERDATRGRHGPAAEHETPATGDADAHEPATYRNFDQNGIAPVRLTARRMPYALRYRGRSALSKWINRVGASSFAGGHSADSQYGHARWKHLPGYALQLLLSKLRVEEGHQFLPEKRWRHLLGRAGKLEMPGRLLDGHRASAGGARGARPPGLTLRQTRSPSVRPVQQRRDRLHQAQTR